VGRAAQARATAPRDPALARRVHHLRTSAMYAVLDVLGDPWVLRLVDEIGRGRGRFDALVTTLGAPRSTVAARLRRLVDDGVVVAEPYSDSPPRFDYRLTEMGRGALGPVRVLAQWSQRHAPGRAPPPSGELHSCGAPLVLDVVCGACSASLEPRTATVLDFPPGAEAPAEVAPAPGYRRTRQGTGRLPAAALISITAEECLGDRWISLVLGALLFGLHRFRDLETALGIAPNILSSRLVQLADAGMITRTEGARGEYRLTAKGVALHPAILALVAWGERWLEPGWAARAGWSLLHRPCASWLQPQLVCAACRAPVASAA
jgi:DNA-binding HxlR family transcriptional regulator